MIMQIITTQKDLKSATKAFKTNGYTIGYVPTMGALHEGHLSLVDLAKTKSDKIIVSIFVNPTQFAPHEDFATYPRDIEGDARQLAALGIDVIYAPSEDEMYPDGQHSAIKAGYAAKGLETDFRPHFFDGVVNIVARLFDHVAPDIAVFGEKDYQQLCVIREMVNTLHLPITIIGAPIVRDNHGLALSSRNAYLSPEELEIARTLNKVLLQAKDDIEGGTAFEENTYKDMLLQSGFDSVDYISYCAANTLSGNVENITHGRILAAAWLGKTRLIDNIGTFYAS